MQQSCGVNLQAALDWIFKEKKDDQAAEVRPGLFLGSALCLQNPEFLERARLARILTVSHSLPDTSLLDENASGFRHVTIPIRDSSEENLIAILPRCFEVINEGLHAWNLRLRGVNTDQTECDEPQPPHLRDQGDRQRLPLRHNGEQCLHRGPSTRQSHRGNCRRSEDGNSSGAWLVTQSRPPPSDDGVAVVQEYLQDGAAATTTDDDEGLLVNGAADRGGVLVHCVAGRSRSAAVVIAYLMFAEHLGFAAAVKAVKKARPGICLNSGFLLQLYEFEGMLRVGRWG